VSDSNRIALILIVVVATFAWVLGWVSGWRSAARAFPRPSHVPTIWLDKFAICVVGNGPMKIPVRVGADPHGIFLSAVFPLSLLYPRIFAPWDAIEFHGPRWFNREDLEIGGFEIAVPRALAGRIKEARAMFAAGAIRDQEDEFGAGR